MDALALAQAPDIHLAQVAPVVHGPVVAHLGAVGGVDGGERGANLRQPSRDDAHS